MRKGVRSLQNIQLLKWCMELDIHPVWNLIWGFPVNRRTITRWLIWCRFCHTSLLRMLLQR